MKPATKKSSKQSGLVTAGIVVVVLCLLAGGLVYLVMNDKGGGKKTFVAKVDLVKPNVPDRPPPPPKEKPPEPEIQKKEAIVTPADVSQAQASAAKGDNKPAAEGPLGVQGDGSAGSDGFGLAARGRGGKDVTTVGTGYGIGGEDQAALLRKYGSYGRLIQDELTRAVRKRLDENGGIPKGKLECVVQIEIDEGGGIKECRITRPSGNSTMDQALKESSGHVKISEAPPQGMRKRISIRVTSQG